MMSLAMPVWISMLRGVNLVHHNRIKMDALRGIYAALQFDDPRTYIQSGNVIFRAKEKNADALAEKIQYAIERSAGFRPAVILRTPQELRKTIAANPFAGRELDPSKLLVNFFAAKPSPAARVRLLALKPDPEELHLIGREVYIYFPIGVGQSKLQWSSLEKKLEAPAGTARNWNGVTRMLQMAEEMMAEE
jgi:uncharacterized protein (DUF1697 family)